MSIRTMQTPDENLQPASAGEYTQPTMSVGEQLRSARESRGLTVADMSGILKLSPRQIEALEADDWDYLPVTTILRGFVRNYSRALKLDTAALMAQLDATVMPAAPELHMPAATNATVPVERSLARRDFLRVVSGAVILVVAVLAYFVLPQDFFASTLSRLKSVAPFASLKSDKDETGEKSAEAPLAAPATTPTVEAPAAAGDAVAVAPPGTAPQASPVPAPAAATASAPVAASEKNALVLSFRQAAWVEVRDRSGAVVFSQLSQPGTQREIEGKPPYSLVVGNAGHVSVTYKGKAVDLSKRSKDDVARVTVE